MVDAYIDGVYPKSVYDAIVDLQGDNKSATQSEWLSQPRYMTDNTTEVIRYTFGRPASISAVSFDIKRIGIRFELHYKDRQGTVRPLLQQNRQVVAYNVVADEDQTYSHYTYETYPVVATELELRMVRRPTTFSPAGKVSVSVKDMLIKRSINNRQDASFPIPDMTDSLGNNVTNVVRDWAAESVVDGSTNTFWKSEPQPSPDAVVSLYVDTRDEYGNAQWIDHFFIDPVSAGQELNVYWSNDDTEGPNLLSESIVAPDKQENTTYEIDKGLLLKNEDAILQFKSSDINLDTTKSHWFGFQWSPDFAYTTGRTAYLMKLGDLEIMYNAQKITLSTGKTSTSIDVEPWVIGDTLNVVAGLNTSKDSERQGLYLAYTPAHLNEPVTSDKRGVHIFDEAPIAHIGDKEVELEDYFSYAGGRYTPIKSKLQTQDILSLTIPNNSVGYTGENKVLSFYAKTDMKYGSLADNRTLPRIQLFNSNDDMIHEVIIPKTHPELIPNPTLEADAAQLGVPYDVGAPIGKAAKLTKMPLFFDAYSTLQAKQGDTFLCTFYTKTIYGATRPEPVLSTGDYKVSRHNVIETLEDGWTLQSCIINVNQDIESANIGFKATPVDTSQNVDDNMSSYIAGMSLKLQPEQTNNEQLVRYDIPSSASVKSIRVIYEKTPGTWSISLPQVTTMPKDGSYDSGDNKLVIGDLGGYLSALIVKQEPIETNQAEQFMQFPDIYILPDPGQRQSDRTSLSNALIVGRLAWEEAFRGGADSTKFTSKSWIPVYSNWTVSRKWYYLPQATKMKYLKLEFTNLVMEPYPVWEDGIKTTYQVYPVSVTETSQKLAQLDTTTDEITTTTTNRTDEYGTTVGIDTALKQFHDQSVDRDTQTSTSYSETTLPRDYEIDIQNPILTDFPVESGITLETEFESETTNSVIYKGSTTETESSTTTRQWQTNVKAERLVAREVTKTWTETKIVPRTKVVSRDVYYRVQPGDCLITIAKKLGIPDWKVIYAYNIWLQSDPRVSMLPKRSEGWWIFPGQNFRIPNAVMEQITVYETVKVQRSSTETVYDKVHDNVQTDYVAYDTTTIDRTIDRTITREETLSTTRNKFRSESVHRYDYKTVERTNWYAYFASIREVIIAKTNWLNERDTALFDFVDYEADGFNLVNVKKVNDAVYMPDDNTKLSQIISPTFSTVSEFRTVKILGVNKESILRSTQLDLSTFDAYLPQAIDDTVPEQAAWQDDEETWKSNTAPWGSQYNVGFTKLVVDRSSSYVTVTGGEASKNASVIITGIKARKGTLTSASIDATPLTDTSADNNITARIIDLDNGEELAFFNAKESSLTKDVAGTIRTGTFFSDRDRDNLAYILTIENSASINYRFSNPLSYTGSMRFLMRNTPNAQWEDVSMSVGVLDGIYSFRTPGRKLEIIIEMSDQNDWSAGLQVIPLYMQDRPN